MKDTITLSAEEYQWALKHIANIKNGILVDPMPSGPEDPCNSVLDKALTLEEKLDAIDERLETESSDVILWFIRKYQLQEGLPLSV